MTTCVAESTSGFSLVECLVVAALIGGLTAASLPILIHTADAADATAAARHIAGLVARARFEAARRNRVVALRFADQAADPAYTLVADGDGDGVGSADVAAGIDAAFRPPDRLSAHFAARFAVAGGIPEIDGTGTLTSLDAPIRLGVARQVSISPIGTATSGTVYIASRRGVQYAVRISGVTGRVRVLRYVPVRASGSRCSRHRPPGGAAPRRRRYGLEHQAQLRPGLPVVVLNLSTRGALVESRLPCRPGGRTELQLDSPDGRRRRAAGEVLRCWVASLAPLRFRSAVCFERRSISSATTRVVGSGFSKALRRAGKIVPGTATPTEPCEFAPVSRHRLAPRVASSLVLRLGEGDMAETLMRSSEREWTRRPEIGARACTR